MFPPDVPSVAATAVPTGAPILDVREQDEWDAGHIAQAIHIPLAELPVRFGELPADGELYVVCRSGGRSSRAVGWLVSNGLEAVNLEGGMGAWADSGLPLVSETGEPPYVR